METLARRRRCAKCCLRLNMRSSNVSGSGRKTKLLLLESKVQGLNLGVLFLLSKILAYILLSGELDDSSACLFPRPTESSAITSQYLLTLLIAKGLETR